ncbi:DMT family transporter [Haloferula helveola]|uniref:DMT family transporter n=1 Tax=Haloferula helveola TaxID=490095 RepID=UPI0030A6710F
MPAFFLILACALWGLSFPVIKAIQFEQATRMDDAGSAFLAAWLQVARFLVAGLLLLPFVLRMPKVSSAELRQGILLGFWGGLGMVLQAWGLTRTDASTSAFLTQAYCVILPLIACLKFRRTPAGRTLLATLLVVAGGAILAGLKPDQLKLGPGETATLLAAFAFTFQILTLDHPRFATNRGRPVTLVMCLAIAVIFLPVVWFTAPTPGAIITAGASWPAATMVVALAVFCSIGAFLLMNTWQRRVSATEAGLIYTTEPVFAAAYAIFLPAPLAAMAGIEYGNETITLQMLTGGGLIVIANVLMQWKARPHKPAVAPAP